MKLRAELEIEKTKIIDDPRVPTDQYNYSYIRRLLQNNGDDARPFPRSLTGPKPGGTGKGERKRKTVCGHKIHDKIVQINLKIIKVGSKKIEEIFPATEKKKEAAEEAHKKK